MVCAEACPARGRPVRAVLEVQFTGWTLSAENDLNMEHSIPSRMLRGRVKVHLVGVGGNGAQMANALARLDIAIRALGHPAGLHVTAFDADKVSQANVGRQVYGPADVGQYKSILQVNRLNAFYGLDWEAIPSMYEPQTGKSYGNTEPDLVISCVDSARARAMLHRAFFGAGHRHLYWMDLGNTDSTGQVVLGVASGHKWRVAEEWGRLPCVTELFPELLREELEEDNTPSCSVAISLASQGLFVNDMVVRWGAHLLYELFTEGRIAQHGVVVNLKSKRAGPIDVNPDVWRRFGVKRRRPKRA